MWVYSTHIIFFHLFQQTINTKRGDLIMGKLSDKDKAFLLSLKPEDIDFNLLVDLFADKVEKKEINGKTQIVHKPSRIKTYDTFELKKGEYFNDKDIVTNAGLFIYNKLIVEKRLKDVLGYVNETIDKKVLGKIEDKLSKALLNDKITVDDMVDYLNKTQWLAMKFHPIVTSSFTMNTLKPHKDVIELRDKLLAEHKEKIEQGDVITATKIEQELLKLAKEKLKGDPGLYLYESGARGSFGNNFKNISVMKGAVYNPTTGQFDIVKSNFMEGIKKEELATYGNAIVTGAYPKAIGTAVSGYFSKQIIAALQAVVMDEKGSDCDTKGYLTVKINSYNARDFLYRYIIENGKLVLLDDDNIDKYIGKEVKMRSVMYCIGDKICRTCLGLMYEKLGITNVGLTTAKVSSSLLNLSMKKFHDTSSKISKIDIDNISL